MVNNYRKYVGLELDVSKMENGVNFYRNRGQRKTYSEITFQSILFIYNFVKFENVIAAFENSKTNV